MLPGAISRVLGGPTEALGAALDRGWSFAARVGVGLALLSLLSVFWAPDDGGDRIASVVVVLWHVLSISYAAFR